MREYQHTDLTSSLIDKMDLEINNMVTTLVVLVVTLSLANLMIVSLFTVLFTRIGCCQTRNPFHCLEWAVKKIRSFRHRNDNNNLRQDKNNKIYDEVVN